MSTYAKVIDHDHERYGEVGEVLESAPDDVYLMKFDGSANPFESFQRDQIRIVPAPREDRPEQMLKHEIFDPQLYAIAYVHQLFYGPDSDNPLETDDIYIVWFTNVLQNWKALVSTNAKDDRYYELTHNGDKNETYVDVYGKLANLVININHGDDGTYSVTSNDPIL